MMTLRLFLHGLGSMPTATAWYLADLGQAKGKQELFTGSSLKRDLEQALADLGLSDKVDVEIE